MESIKSTASGATNTESGKSKESKPSLLTPEEKVKMAKVNDVLPEVADPKAVQPYDYRTEMFMLSVLNTVLKGQYALNSTEKYDILTGVFVACSEANGL